ncbi:MAG TPA: ATP-binding cassette domain-containing protein [Ureibacillus sp.]|nr:ATP-binding cassette domain-containing protein [Ureibacillus sp.]
MTETILKAMNISKIYGAHKALDKVSIEIKRGMIYGLIGENGAGKSTFMWIVFIRNHNNYQRNLKHLIYNYIRGVVYE